MTTTKQQQQQHKTFAIALHQFTKRNQRVSVSRCFSFVFLLSLVHHVPLSSSLSGHSNYRVSIFSISVNWLINSYRTVLIISVQLSTAVTCRFQSATAGNYELFINKSRSIVKVSCSFKRLKILKCNTIFEFCNLDFMNAILTFWVAVSSCKVGDIVFWLITNGFKKSY